MSFPEIKKNFGFGCMRLPMKDDQVDYEEFNRMIDAFIDAGFNYFDTAHGYIGGKSELAIRDCLAARYPREKFLLANKLTHPRHSIPKIYHVTLKGKFSPDELMILGESIELDGRATMPVKVTKVGETENGTVARFELFEGRNRQIRRMCEAHNVRILQLTRVAIGKIKLDKLEIGKWRYLNEKEIHYLKTV